MGLEKKKLVFNPLSGNFDYIALDNHSYTMIPLGRSGLIQSNQQMFVTGVGPYIVEGELQVDGELIIDDFKDPATETKNFSYKTVDTGELIQIEASQQMIVDGLLTVEGELQVEGELSIIDDEIPPTPTPTNFPDNFSYKNIPLGTITNVPIDQQMIVDGLLTVEGELQVEGELSIIDDELIDIDPNDGNFLPPYHIDTGESFTVPIKKQFFSAVALELDGTLVVEGILILGA